MKKLRFLLIAAALFAFTGGLYSCSNAATETEEPKTEETTAPVEETEDVQQEIEEEATDAQG